jgi:hypothetical protein
MSLTGHTTEKMKKHYTHFDTTQFSEVVEVQEQLLIAGKPEGGPAKKPEAGTGKCDVVKSGGRKGKAGGMRKRAAS